MCLLWTKEASVYRTIKCQTKVLTDLFDKIVKRFWARDERIANKYGITQLGREREHQCQQWDTFYSFLTTIMMPTTCVCVHAHTYQVLHAPCMCGLITITTEWVLLLVLILESIIVSFSVSVIKYWPKATWKERVYFTLHFQAIVHIQGMLVQVLKMDTRNGSKGFSGRTMLADLLCIAGSVSFRIKQGLLVRNGIVHSGLGFLTLIINIKKNAPKTWTQASLREEILWGFFFTVSDLTKTNQHTNCPHVTQAPQTFPFLLIPKTLWGFTIFNKVLV